MLLILPDVLPPPPMAAELARRLPQTAPTLAAWLAGGTADVTAFDPADHGCTPYQGWRLRAAGHVPPAGVPLGSGWAVLEALALGATPGTLGTAPVWLADLAHLEVSTDGFALADASLWQVSAQDDAALLAAAQPYLEDAGMTAQPLAPGRWRMTLPDGVTPYAATPEAAGAAAGLQDWWPQQPEARAWRRLANAMQMAWHQHPANDARAARGLAPINGVWLQGGSAYWPQALQAPPARQPTPELVQALGAAVRRADWHAWLQALAALDRTLLAPLPAAPASLVLTGQTRLVTVTPLRGLRRWLPRRDDAWHAWWSDAT